MRRSESDTPTSDNPWQQMTLEEARLYDARKDYGPLRNQIAIKRELLWRQIKKRLPKDLSTPVLDLGGGTGVWAIRIALEGYQVILADISPAFLERAKEKALERGVLTQITFVEADILDLSRWDENAFPFVLAVGAPLSYSCDLTHALNGVRRIMAKNGVLLADVENKYGSLDARRAANWDEVRRILRYGVASWPGCDTPIRQYSPTEVQGCAKAAGWSIVTMEPTDVLPRLLCGTDVGKMLSANEEALPASEMRSCLVMESRLRKDSSLLGCGTEIQFVAKNRG